MVSIRRTFQGLETNVTEALRLKPNPVFDVAPGQQRPIGAASSAEGILTVLLFPGEGVFDELWDRNVTGGPMPSILNLGIRAEGEVWQDGIIAWDTSLHPQLAVMTASFKATTMFVWPNTRYPNLRPITHTLVGFSHTKVVGQVQGIRS